MSLLNHEPSQCAPKLTSRLTPKLAHAPRSLALSTQGSPWPRASPSGVPPTPELLRSSSSSSHRTNDSPSPTTPAQLFEPRLRVKAGEHPPLLSSLTDAAPAQLHHSPRSAYPLLSPRLDPSDLGSACSRSNGSVSPPDSPMTVSAKPMPKKYPCQFAERLGCRDMFTTSGHASRHAKKHTGEKNVPCPRCPKKFARKDNMKQHLKTHETRGADASSSSAEDGPRAAKVQRRTDDVRSVARRSAAAVEASSHEPGVDDSRSRPQLHRSSATFAVPRRDFTLYDGRDQLPSPAISACHPTSLTPGLEALLIAADAQRPVGYEARY